MTATDRALAWNAEAQACRRRAALLERMALRVTADPHPAAETFARFYAICAADEQERAAFCDDVARACLEDAA